MSNETLLVAASWDGIKEQMLRNLLDLARFYLLAGAPVAVFAFALIAKRLFSTAPSAARPVSPRVFVSSASSVSARRG